MESFEKKISIIIHQIDLKEKKWVAFNQESPNEKHEISLDNMDIKNGIRFCCTLYDPKDYVHVKRFQIFSENQKIESYQITSQKKKGNLCFIS